MYQTPKFAGAVRYNAPKGCATRLCRACVELTVCVAVRYPITANISRNKRNGNPTAVPYFRSGRRSLVCARLSNKGKAGVQRGRKTAGCPSFLPTAVGTASSPPRGAARSRRPQTANPHAEIQRKTSRPLGANPPAAVRAPRLSGADKEPPRQGEHADAVRVPRTIGAEKEPPRQGEHADAVRAPRSADAEKEPPRQGEHANAVRAPRSAGAENPGNPEKIFPAEKTEKRPFSR